MVSEGKRKEEGVGCREGNGGKGKIAGGRKGTKEVEGRWRRRKLEKMEDG